MRVIRQFLLFLVFGGCAAVVSVFTGWLLYRNSDTLLPYPLAVSIGATAAIVVNFGLNYVFNFSFRGRSMLAQFQTFATVAVIGVFITALLAWLFELILSHVEMDGFGVGKFYVTAKLAAHILAVGCVTFYSFLAHKFFSFNIGFVSWCRSKFSTISK